mgnify:CR=1 FL=1
MVARKSFCVVCIANYCRSPVAENLLRHRYGHKYEFFSAGISPIAQPNMDPRSQQFLKKNNVNYSLHNPKKINRKMLDYFDVFFAVDLFVLNELNSSYSNYKQKFCLLTADFSDVNITDPYLFDEDGYLRIMRNIKYVTENINLENSF